MLVGTEVISMKRLLVKRKYSNMQSNILHVYRNADVNSKVLL